MTGFPREFADMLTPQGRRILDGRHPSFVGALAERGRFFAAIGGAVDRRKALAAQAALESALYPHLRRLEQGIPPESISAQTRNHQERLIKTVRVSTAYLERRGAAAWRAAERIGLIAMTGSDTWHRFAEILAGRALDRRSGRQVLCYGAGDYSGPHTDHHPEDPRARDGYVDIHLTLATKGVAHQWLVYAEGGHFRHVLDVATVGGITAYRLPFWHYTTPLAAKRGQADKARRWVVLGTFRYAQMTGRRGTAAD